MRLGHIALAVPSLSTARAQWQQILQKESSAVQSLSEHGVRLVFFDLENTRLELLEPMGEDSPLASFLAKNPRGGLHHICLEVQAIDSLHARLTRCGVADPTDYPLRQGAHARSVFFLHPRVLSGTLLEFEQADKGEDS